MGYWCLIPLILLLTKGISILQPLIEKLITPRIHSLYLSKNDDEEDEDSGQEVVEIGRASSVEGLVKGIELILLGGDEME